MNEHFRREIAVARLMLDNFPHIKSFWIMNSAPVTQSALWYGADDVDGIAAADPGTLGTRRSAIEEITGNIRAARLDPTERDGLFMNVDFAEGDEPVLEGTHVGRAVGAAPAHAGGDREQGHDHGHEGERDLAV